MRDQAHTGEAIERSHQTGRRERGGGTTGHRPFMKERAPKKAPTEI